ncbi:YkgJ family cysteine cluster protein [Sphaerochaeta halotolerans]|uniref:YkgJ family cysteine cluster protein n=1 Tax=Sphaerochaeta halotolerans TaxID=2293840 RepID=UPI00136A3C0D|nr:YkgJ family cysteine cluster protein [Sphaerochaeta halotolerans]MXI85758.1 YkgJ family cysteine cluster protein [Sphaerochaeta halotolerans]
MDSIEELIRAFEGTYVGQNMADLVELYSTIEKQTNNFCSNYSIACGSGCGTCCEHFMPDITVSEARLVAAYLLLFKKDTTRIEAVNNAQGNTSGPCPLYDPDSSHHCTVYQARPLICRLFGACASQGKDGRAVFRRCKYNGEQTMPLSLTFDEDVPVMQDYSYALRSLDDGNGKVGYLSEMVSSLVEQLRFLSSMLSLDDTNPDDTPTPLAS